MESVTPWPVAVAGAPQLIGGLLLLLLLLEVTEEEHSSSRTFLGRHSLAIPAAMNTRFVYFVPV